MRISKMERKIEGRGINNGSEMNLKADRRKGS